MPTLASVKVPTTNWSASGARSHTTTWRTPVSPRLKPRMYGDKPLPVKPSNDAPVKARIVSRVMDYRGAWYSVKIGEVEINDVGIDEVLEYVSARHLEEYENQQFEEEAELRRIAELEEERIESERQERRKEKARLKGLAIRQQVDGINESLVESTDGAEVAPGRHGRARPTYKHLFKKLKERRRRKRDPVTGELMPLSDDAQDPAALESSDDEHAVSLSTTRPLTAAPMEQKRRRRKRDKVTGELLPLSPEAREIGVKKKRQRRRRHPLTGQLMPIGWRYDPDAPNDVQRTSGANAVSPAMKRMSISQEQAPKRVKLDHPSSSAGSSSAHVVIEASAEERSEDETSESDEKFVAEALEKFKSKTMLEPKPTPTLERMSKQMPKATAKPSGMLVRASNVETTSTSSEAESSSDDDKMTSILQPAAQTPGGTGAIESDAIDEDEWYVEAIMAHHLSDPRTHPAELGKKPVMLYHVKWEGFDELTWEPEESFSDRSVLEEYQRRAGLLRNDTHKNHDVD